MAAGFERPFPISKDVLDTLNSVSWFLMDASWMLENHAISGLMIIPTIMTGLFLCYIEKRRNITFINLAILSWICMNVCWMGSEVLAMAHFLTVAKTLFVVGVGFIALAVATSDNLSDTFSHFRRFRIIKR